MTKLDEATSVVNKADTVSAQQAVTAADDQIIAKPQVISAGLKSKHDIQTYIAKRGDTISTVASKFDVTADTIRLSNNLTQEGITPGKKLYISPVNGIVYRVKSGDTPESLASRYRTNKAQLIAFNDAELTGRFIVGDLIVIPNGVDPSAGVSSSALTASTSGGYGFGIEPVYGGNGYDYGYCTYWSAIRRAQIGRPIPSNLGNASSWVTLAARAGLPTGNSPRRHAVISTGEGGYYGHVAFVERVNSDGSVYLSEMNMAGWNRVSHRTIPASQASNYQYIY